MGMKKRKLKYFEESSTTDNDKAIDKPHIANNFATQGQIQPIRNTINSAGIINLEKRPNNERIESSKGKKKLDRISTFDTISKKTPQGKGTITMTPLSSSSN
jgi:hypothetical protein